MRKSVTIIKCDICNRDSTKVDTEYNSGSGNLKFHWSLGGCGGGASGDINFDDLCCECTARLRKILDELKYSHNQH